MDASRYKRTSIRTFRISRLLLFLLPSSIPFLTFLLLSLPSPLYKRPLGRIKRRQEDNIKMYFKETGCEAVDSIHLAPDRDQWRALVNTVMNLRVSQKAVNFSTSSVAMSF
jgi:hypothetical protein